MFPINNSKPDDNSLSVAGTSITGTDLGAYSSSKSEYQCSPSKSKQGNGKAYWNNEYSIYDYNYFCFILEDNIIMDCISYYHSANWIFHVRINL